ncbi:MAG: hypothetical protein ACJASR_001928, partial [Psychroserpens sp.]
MKLEFYKRKDMKQVITKFYDFLSFGVKNECFFKY